LQTGQRHPVAGLDQHQITGNDLLGHDGEAMAVAHDGRAVTPVMRLAKSSSGQFRQIQRVLVRGHEIGTLL